MSSLGVDVDVDIKTVRINLSTREDEPTRRNHHTGKFI